MDNETVINILKDITNDRGIPKNVKTLIEESMKVIQKSSSGEEKLAHIISILDEASNDPNISPHTRTLIWNAVSTLEEMKNKK